MVLIPPDIGLRLRLQNELLPQPITPLQEIPADLPELKTGQTFNARIQEVLPENTYRALVAGKSITLSLPESAKTGDQLELVVVDRTPKSIIARLASPAAPAGDNEVTAGYPHATFSAAARLIGALLPPEGKSPAAAPLNRGQPLLAQPPQSGAELAPTLGKAVSQSGLFYESHQAQWVAGKRPLASLLQEPQGMRSSPQARIAAQADLLAFIANAKQNAQAQPLPTSSAPAQTAAQPGMQQTAIQPMPPSEVPLPQVGETSGNKLPATVTPQDPESQTSAPGNPPALTGKAESNLPTKEAMPPQQPGSPSATPHSSSMDRRDSVEVQRQRSDPEISQPITASSIPDQLKPLVQQQLDAAGTQRLIWHGEVWPGQTMQWEIEWKNQAQGNSEQDGAEPWTTTLRLETPRLGALEASLRLGVRGVHIALATPFGDTAADLRAGASSLEQALAAAGVPMRGFNVKRLRDEAPEVSGNADG